MALTNSISFMRARGKIGNLYLSHDRSGQHAKSLQVSGSARVNDAMLLNQKKALPAFRLWGYCNPALFGLHALRKLGWNRYNVFCSMIIPKIPAESTLSNSELFDTLVGLNYGSNKAMRVNQVTVTDTSINVNYYLFPQMLPNFKYCMVLINDSSRGGYKFIDHKLTNTEELGSFLSVPYDFITPTSVMVYLYTKDRKITSNVMFVSGL